MTIIYLLISHSLRVGYVFFSGRPLKYLLFLFAACYVFTAASSFAFSEASTDNSAISVNEMSIQQNHQEPKETVIINDTEYAVPLSWRGHKITMPDLTFPAVELLPTELTKNGSKIYLLKKAHDALVAMTNKAKQDNIILFVKSGYRSARYQNVIFQRLMKKGRAFEDIARFIAPPGYSEHMLGTAVDFCPSDWRFANSSEYLWLKQHAGEFGFTETFPEQRYNNKPWEPWHWRYRDNTEELLPTGN